MLLMAHSGVRYIVLLFGVLAAVYALVGVLRGSPYNRTMSILGSAFAGSIHLQILLGFGVIFSGRFFSALVGHMFLMAMAAFVAQIISSTMRRKPEQERTYMPHLIGSVVALLLIAAGIMSIGRSILGSTVGG